MKKRIFDRLISVITGLTLVFSAVHCFPDSIINANSDTAPAFSAAVSDKKAENPFNKQDDKEVPYDGKYWVQPKEWNTPAIDTKDYEGGIMLFFDKIGLDPDYAKGKVQRVYFSIVGAAEPISYIKFHIFYDTRLTVRENSNGEVMNAGKGLNDFTTGSAMIEEGQLAFYAYCSEDTNLNNSNLFTIDFIVPENAEQGDVYPIGISYVDDNIVADTFIDSGRSDAGKLQMTYVFTKGIYNGYIKINGEKKTTASTTVTTTTTTTTAPASPAEYKLGDVNNDGFINAVDASSVLAYYARISTNADGGYTDSQKKAADINCDGQINAVDASNILAYYAYISTTKENTVSLTDIVF